MGNFNSPILDSPDMAVRRIMLKRENGQRLTPAELDRAATRMSVEQETNRVGGTVRQPITPRRVSPFEKGAQARAADEGYAAGFGSPSAVIRSPSVVSSGSSTPVGSAPKTPASGAQPIKWNADVLARTQANIPGSDDSLPDADDASSSAVSRAPSVGAQPASPGRAPVPTDNTASTPGSTVARGGTDVNMGATHRAEKTPLGITINNPSADWGGPIASSRTAQGPQPQASGELPDRMRTGAAPASPVKAVPPAAPVSPGHGGIDVRSYSGSRYAPAGSAEEARPIMKGSPRVGEAGGGIQVRSYADSMWGGSAPTMGEGSSVRPAFKPSVPKPSAPTVAASAVESRRIVDPVERLSSSVAPTVGAGRDGTFVGGGGSHLARFATKRSAQDFADFAARQKDEPTVATPVGDSPTSRVNGAALPASVSVPPAARSSSFWDVQPSIVIKPGTPLTGTVWDGTGPRPGWAQPQHDPVDAFAHKVVRGGVGLVKKAFRAGGDSWNGLTKNAIWKPGKLPVPGQTGVQPRRVGW
jgi:hypothetical protein